MKKSMRASLRYLASTAGVVALLPFLGLGAQAQTTVTPSYVGMTPENIGVMERPRPDYDAKGLPFDSWRLFPKLDIGWAYDSNVFRTAAKLDDSYWTISPSLKAMTQWDAGALEAFAGADSYVYDKYSSESLSDWNAGADGRYFVMPGAEIYAAGTVNRLHEQRSSPNTTGFQNGPNEYYLYDIQGSGTYQRGLLGVGAGLQYDRYDFDPVGRIGGGLISNADRNMDELQLWGKVNYDFSPGYQVFIRPSYDQRRFDQFLDRSGLDRASSGTRIDLGVTAQLTHLISGTVEIGYLHQNFVAPLKDADGLAYTINLDWYATPLLTVHLTGDRQLQQSTIANVSVTDDRAFRLSADYELLRDLIVNGHLGYSEDIFTSTTRYDHVNDVGLSAKYLVNSYMSLDLKYDYNQRFSNAIDGAYTDHTVLLGVGLHL